MGRNFNADKQIGINMIANIISYSANIIISFFLTPFLINTLGKETYGFYPIANSIVSYLSILTNSMNSISSRFITVSLTQNNTEEANFYFSSTLSADFIFSVILFFPMLFIVLFLDLLLDVPINSLAAIKTMFTFVFSSAIINIISSVYGIATFAKNRIDLRSLRELVTAIIKLTLFYVFYRFFPPSIVYVGIVSFAVSIINICFQYAYTKKLIPEINIKKKYISYKHTKELFISSCWNSINSFGNNLLSGMSLVLANTLYGVSASGSYSIVNTVPQFINGVIIMISSVFFPVITMKYAQNSDELIDTIKTAQKYVAIVGCSVITVFSSLSYFFFKLWTPNEDPLFLSTLSTIIILPHLFISCLWPLTNVYVAMNRIKRPAIYTLVFGILNIMLAYLARVLYEPGLLSIAIISSFLQVLWIGLVIPQYVCKEMHLKWTTFYLTPIKSLLLSLFIAIIIRSVTRKVAINSWLIFISYGSCFGLLSLLVFTLFLVGLGKMKKAP